MHLRPRRRHALPLIAALLLTAAGAIAPTAAHADRCAPEEIVLGPDTSPIDERDNPACTVLFFYVYPFICAPAGNPPPTLLGPDGCTANLSLNLAYVPPVIPPYNPNAGRLVCNLILYVNPNGTCTFEGNSATGDTRIDSHLGSLTIPAQPATEEGTA
jgi:hypothetical protein